MSGVSFGAVLAYLMNKSLFIVRKPMSVEGAHTQSHEGAIGHRWIFVDDFVSSGATRDHVMRAVEGLAPSAVFVGDYLYQNPSPWRPVVIPR
ncbi:hypothetical protein AB0H43_12770 [Hamadaea sp. NPDC050747]|uniref:hypothetical protein n=1 Tax=Hamadaea sp. NPDC050747 TaxID=3155789 RepID=UPI0033F1B194